MPRKKKQTLPFDNRGGVLVQRTHLLKSDVYLSLSPQAKVLMTLLQIQWRNDKPVDYGIREAREKIPCSDKTASKAFNQLQERGFIACVEESFFSSRTQSRTRSWRLEWLPFNDRPPTNTWEKLANEN
tara:strand:+ start:174382 stop:174765 length:384 start_codon:yes stop_codon:yes gene_type:complete